MATVPGQLIWEIVKKNNSFLVKQFGRGTASVQFSKEPNNLYNLNSYKHSGLANKKTVTIQSGGKDQSVLLATTKTKKQNKPSSLLHKSVMRKEFPRMAKAVKNQVWYCLHSNSNFLKVLSCGDEAITGGRQLLQARFNESSPCKVECCEQESEGCQVWCQEEEQTSFEDPRKEVK
ncbi:hypothetical protein SCA6_019626 [Theobroma cacao]|uniref:60S ribosomal protein L28-1 isoform X1 n=1 Tax=Theobroma cacao TaxID=3641 RepID=A0AB32WPL1_THECC|nr:PREDICTED: 60S ribosomal protein L28-1 isoform X1 [Theobroma cacao]